MKEIKARKVTIVCSVPIKNGETKEETINRAMNKLELMSGIKLHSIEDYGETKIYEFHHCGNCKRENCKNHGCNLEEITGEYGTCHEWI